MKSWLGRIARKMVGRFLIAWHRLSRTHYKDTIHERVSTTNPPAQLHSKHTA